MMKMGKKKKRAIFCRGTGGEDERKKSERNPANPPA
jgi:hypothetical protein